MWSTVPAPERDELWPSFVTRVFAARGEVRPAVVRKALFATLRSGPVEAELAIARHTNLGYARFVSKEHAGRPVHRHCDVLGNANIFQLGLSPGVLRFCPICHQEDRERYGIAHWRRTHQLPGLVLCKEHHTPLVDLQRSCMTRVDDLVRPLTNVEAPAAWEKWATHPVIQRFVDLSHRAGQVRASIAPGSISVALKKRALAQGLSLTENGRRTRLSDWMRDRLPSGWVAAHFPGVMKREHHEAVPMVDGVFRMQHAAYKTASYLVAMALLWESADEAFASCTEPADLLGTTPQIDAGHLALSAVLAGRSIRAACKAANARLADLERAIRARLCKPPAEPLDPPPVARKAAAPTPVQTKEATMGLLAELEGC